MTTLSSEAERLADKCARWDISDSDKDDIAAILRRIPELEAWKAKVIKAAEEAHGPGAFRFKMSLNSRGTASNVFPQWLDQRWVSFVYAEDDAHIGLHARIAQLEAERDQLRAELEKVRVPEGWKLVDNKDSSITVSTPAGGCVTLWRTGQGSVESIAYRLAQMLLTAPAQPAAQPVQGVPDEVRMDALEIADAIEDKTLLHRDIRNVAARTIRRLVADPTPPAQQGEPT